MAGAPTPPSENVSGTNVAGVSGQGIDQGLVSALAAAVQTGVQQGMQGVSQHMADMAGSMRNVESSLTSLTENVNKNQAAITSLTEQVNKVSISGETDSGLTLRGVSITDPGDSMVKGLGYRDQIGATMLKGMQTHFENLDAMAKQYLTHFGDVLSVGVDHHRVLPPMSPRVPSGPGSVDAKVA